MKVTEQPEVSAPNDSYSTQWDTWERRNKDLSEKMFNPPVEGSHRLLAETLIEIGAAAKQNQL